MRIGVNTQLDATLGRAIYRTVTQRVRLAGWHLVRRFGMSYPLDRVSTEHIDVLIAPVRDRKIEQQLLETGVCIINYTNLIETERMFQVVHDQRAIGVIAANYLLQRGFERIGLVAYSDSVFSNERRAGFLEGLQAAGREVPRVLSGSVAELDAQKLSQQLASETEPLEALYCVNDYLAAQVIFALEKLGLAVPTDVSVLGTDHEELTSCWLGRALSSVVLDYAGMADAITGTLTRIAADPRRSPERVVVPPLEVFSGETVSRRLPQTEGLRAAVQQLRADDLRGLDIDRLARLAGQSRRQFQSRFKAEMHQTAGAAIIEARIDLAKRLLAERGPTLESIAEQCGYADRHHFSVRFKAETDFTPAAYRKRVRRE